MSKADEELIASHLTLRVLQALHDAVPTYIDSESGAQKRIPMSYIFNASVIKQMQALYER